MIAWFAAWQPVCTAIGAVVLVAWFLFVVGGTTISLVDWFTGRKARERSARISRQVERASGWMSDEDFNRELDWFIHHRKVR